MPYGKTFLMRNPLNNCPNCVAIYRIKYIFAIRSLILYQPSRQISFLKEDKHNINI